MFTCNTRENSLDAPRKGRYLERLVATFVVRRPASATHRAINRVPNIAKALSTSVQVVKELKHLLTHRTIFANMFFIRLEQEITLPEPYQWVKEDEIEQYAHSRLVELLLEKVRDYLETNH